LSFRVNTSRKVEDKLKTISLSGSRLGRRVAIANFKVNGKGSNCPDSIV